MIYSAIVRAGPREQAEKLYLNEAHVRIVESQLALLVGRKQGGTEWSNVAGELRHARQEEQQLFPQLHQRLAPDGNFVLADLYARQFGAVLPVRVS